MDATQALKDTENSLRDFIADSLNKSLGANWIENCGVSLEKVEKWKERKEVERKRQEAGVVEERLLYYADFYDLKTILKKKWQDEFSIVFGDWKTMEVLLTELEKLRDPDAHRRELLPHQKHFILGISGEIRNRIIRYRSKQEMVEDYFPKIESARDSLGNIWTPGMHNVVETGMCLREGDTIDFVVTASDPYGEVLRYSLISPNRDILYGDSNVMSWNIMNDQVGKHKNVILNIISNRDYHALSQCDDWVAFIYDVLPKR
jgi:hypothetical protein